MKSRLGLKPNGVLLLSHPKEHFKAEDFINAIDKWSKGIKNNPIQNFTSKIKITQAQVFPLYLIRATKTYEQRSLESNRRTGKTSWAGYSPSVSIHNINIWSYDVEYTGHSHSITIDGSTYNENCNRCNGAGEIVSICNHCNGHKTIVTEKSHNDGTKYTVRENCYHCSGNGNVSQKCSECSGTGGFTNSISLLIDYELDVFKQNYCVDQIFEFGNDLKLEDTDYYFYNNINSTNDLISLIDGDIRDQAIGQFVTFEKEPHSKSGNYLGTETRYAYTFVAFVSYTYEDLEYDLMIYGANDKVYAPYSPLSKVIDNSLTDANDFLLAYDFKAASQIIKDLNKIEGHKKEVTNVVVKFRDKLSEATFSLSTHTKTGVLKKYWLQRASHAYGNKKLNTDKLYSVRVELGFYFFAPLLSVFPVAILLYAYFKNEKIQVVISKIQDELVKSVPDDQTYWGHIMLGTLTPLFVGAFVVFCFQFIQNRKKNLFYNSWWKYLVHSVLVMPFVLPIYGVANEMILHFAQFSFLGSLFLLTISYFGLKLITGLMIKFLSDENSFQGEAATVDGFLPCFIKNHCREMNEIIKYLPSSNFSYADEWLQEDKTAKAKKLSDMIKFISDANQDLNFYPCKEKKKSA